MRHSPQPRSPKGKTPEGLFEPVVVVDNNENLPYTFQNIPGYSEIWTESRSLVTGDYSLAGHEDYFCVERKSLADLFATLSTRRDCFVDELGRMDDMAARYGLPCFVVVEAQLADVTNNPPARSQLRPASVLGSVFAWQFRHPLVHWVFCDGRRDAELVTFRLLQRYWTEYQKEV